MNAWLKTRGMAVQIRECLLVLRHGNHDLTLAQSLALRQCSCRLRKLQMEGVKLVDSGPLSALTRSITSSTAPSAFPFIVMLIVVPKNNELGPLGIRQDLGQMTRIPCVT
jgi:hypothetical protein